MNGIKSNNVTLELFNTTGIRVSYQTINITSDKQLVAFNQKLPSGIYTLRVNINGAFKGMKLLVF